MELTLDDAVIVEIRIDAAAIWTKQSAKELIQSMTEGRKKTYLELNDEFR
jgi:hypothetical protein